jgi:energy-coupling factor transporter ATP-binding protein EcfA2
LQLKASEKSKNRRIFLLDEPGANLHSKAQGDVLKLINKLGKETSTVIYSTHSPQMLEYPKLFRVHAVQRDGEQDDSPTVVIDAHRLGTASTDTLSPVLTAMGSDLSNHEVIRKENNVLLEEMSGYYYVSALNRPGF